MMRRTLFFSALAVVATASLAARAAAYEAMAVTDGGTLSGTVTIEGTAPPPAKIEVTKDPEVCGKESKEKVNPVLLVGPGGGIANVVVTVKAIKGKKLEVPAEHPLFDQKMCEFHPHVLVFPAGSTCDVHGWMSGYWVATDTPYVAVTDVSGTFKIADLPPGDYDVELWQEKLGKATQKASIKAKEETKVAWKMAAK